MSDYFLADDLSGALDAAAAFHRVGRPVVVALSVDAWPSTLAADAIVGITTETRNARAEVAAREVRRAIAAGRARGARLVYKKIDSTMRGPVAAELAALTAAMPQARVLFTPANPAVGRTVRNGSLLVHGVPVSETEFSRDPVSPVRDSSLPTLLGAAATAQVEIADAGSDADLAAAVARIASAGGPWVGVGSGALARAVAAWGRQTGDRGRDGVPAGEFGGAVVLIGGSAHRVNREQASVLARAASLAVHEVAIGSPTAVVPAATADVRERGAAALILETKRSGSDSALRAIVAAARAVIADTGARRLFVTGGETAFALARELGISCLRFEAELEPGLSLSTAMTPRGPLLLAVKPGGFGDNQTWVRAWTALQPPA